MYTNFDINDKDKYIYLIIDKKIVSVGLSAAGIIATSNLHRSLIYVLFTVKFLH